MISHISNGFQWYPHFIPKWGIPLISPWIPGIPLWNFPSRWSPIGSGDVVPRASNGCCGWRLGRGKNPELPGRSRKTPRKWWFSWENHGKIRYKWEVHRWEKHRTIADIPRIYRRGNWRIFWWAWSHWNGDLEGMPHFQTHILYHSWMIRFVNILHKIIWKWCRIKIMRSTV